MAHPKRTVYDLLAKKDISEVTTTHLDASVSNTRVDKATIDFWKGPITIQRVLELRTYPHGLPIPNEGGIVATAVSPGEDFDIQPPGSEIWRLTGMSMSGAGGTGEAAISYYDGTTSQPIATGLGVTAAGIIIGAYGAVSDIQILNPILLTNAVYWKVLNPGLTYAIQVVYSYQKVSL